VHSCLRAPQAIDDRAEQRAHQERPDHDADKREGEAAEVERRRRGLQLAEVQPMDITYGYCTAGRRPI